MPLPDELEPLALLPSETEPWTTPTDEPPDVEIDVLEVELPLDVELPPAVALEEPLPFEELDDD